MSVRVTPSSLIVAVTLLQLSEPTPTVFCWRFHPVDGNGQVTAMVLVTVQQIESKGAPCVCTAATTPQKPPSSV